MRDIISQLNLANHCTELDYLYAENIETMLYLTDTYIWPDYFLYIPPELPIGVPYLVMHKFNAMFCCISFLWSFLVCFSLVYFYCHCNL